MTPTDARSPAEAADPVAFACAVKRAFPAIDSREALATPRVALVRHRRRPLLGSLLERLLRLAHLGPCEVTDLRRLVRDAGLSLGMLRGLNPTLVRGMTPPGTPWEIRIPRGTREGVLAALAPRPWIARADALRHP